MTEIATFRRRTTSETTPGQAVEARRIEASIRDLTDFAVRPADVEPSKLRKGMVRLAVSPWDPVGAGDGWVYFDGTAWAPLSVPTASLVGFVPAGGISATDVQAAVEELDAEKVSKSGDTMVGDLAIDKTSPKLELRKSNDGAATSSLDFLSGGTLRWRLLHSGAFFGIQRLNSSGVSQGTPLIVRSTDGQVQVDNTMSVGSSATFGGSVTSSGVVSTPGASLRGAAGDGPGTVGFHTLAGPVYHCVIGEANPNWAPCQVQALHFPGVWAGVRLSSNTAVWDFRNDGQAYKSGGGSWADISDADFKFAIEPYTTGLSAILRVDPSVYSYRPETGRDPFRRYIGGIAQNMLEAMPETITTAPATLGSISKQDALSLDPSALPWALVNAVKELNAIVEAQASRIAALEAAASA